MPSSSRGFSELVLTKQQRAAKQPKVELSLEEDDFAQYKDQLPSRGDPDPVEVKVDVGVEQQFLFFSPDQSLPPKQSTLPPKQIEENPLDRDELVPPKVTQKRFSIPQDFLLDDNESFTHMQHTFTKFTNLNKQKSEIEVNESVSQT